MSAEPTAPQSQAPDAESQRKLQPKLRMVANGSTEVNAVRAELACAVAAPEEVAEELAVARMAPAPAAGRERIVAEMEWVKERPKTMVSVFVHLVADLVERRAAPTVADKGYVAEKANLLTAEISVAEAEALRENPAVTYIELGQPLTIPDPPSLDAGLPPPRPEERHTSASELHRFGQGAPWTSSGSCSTWSRTRYGASWHHSWRRHRGLPGRSTRGCRSPRAVWPWL